MRLNIITITLAITSISCFLPTYAIAGTNVAVLNVAEVFEKYEMTTDLETMFETKRRQASEEAESRRSSIDQMRRALTAFDPASADFARRENDLVRAEVEFQVWSTQTENRMKKEHKKWLLQIYKNTREIVAEISQDRGIDVVVTFDELTDDAPDSITLRQQILLQKVIYHNDKVDITQDVLKALNKKYRDSGGSRTLSATPATNPSTAKQ